MYVQVQVLAGAQASAGVGLMSWSWRLWLGPNFETRDLGELLFLRQRQTRASTTHRAIEERTTQGSKLYKMAKRKEPKAKDLKLKQPDRSGPTDKTLLDLAQEKDLFTQAKEREAEIQREKRRAAGENVAEGGEEEEEDNVMSIGAERVMESVLWTATIAMLHLTFDVLVQHQYGTELDWSAVWMRAGRAFLGKSPPSSYTL